MAETIEVRVIFRITPIRLEEDAPQDLPEGTLVFNAARPLYGDHTWRGSFHQGIFYAAVLPDSDRRDAFIKRNVELNGGLIREVTVEEMARQVEAYYQEKWPEGLDRIAELHGDDPLEWPKEHVISTFRIKVQENAVEKIEIDPAKTGGLL